jgi:polar amino acid transport system permease protein
VSASPSERRLAREAAKRARSRQRAIISAVSTVVLLGGLTALIVTSQGWPTVREAFFSPHDFAAAFPDVLRGFWTDVKLFCIVEVVVLVLGLVVALVRTSRGAALFPVRLIAGVYTDLFRGLPTILVVYLVGFGVPALALKGLPTNLLVLGGGALALCYGAYVAEVYRAGIESVHPSQRAAALALGLTEAQTTRHVVLPQAVRRVAPPLLNDFIALQKDVALVSILGPLEAFRVGQIEAASNFIYTPLVAAGVLYLCVTIPLTRYLDRVQRRRRRRLA